MALPEHPEDTSALISDLEAAKAAFHQAADGLTDLSWSKPSSNPGWTNGAVMFHILLAFMLLPYLVPLARFFGALPPAWSRTFATVLDLATPIFNWVNGLGPKGAGTVFSRTRLLRRYDALHDYAVRTVNKASPTDLQRGMHYPLHWDPMFRGFMTVADVLGYPTIHMKHHLGQLAP